MDEETEALRGPHLAKISQPLGITCAFGPRVRLPCLCYCGAPALVSGYTHLCVPNCARNEVRQQEELEGEHPPPLLVCRQKVIRELSCADVVLALFLSRGQSPGHS